MPPPLSVLKGTLPSFLPHKAISELMEHGYSYDDAVRSIELAYPALIRWAFASTTSHVVGMLRNEGKYDVANVVGEFGTKVNEYIDNAGQLGVTPYRALNILMAADYDVQVASAGLIDG